jgi:putative transcriptional regulator
MIKNKVKELRIKLNITQEKLALDLKVTRQTIIAIESHRYNPSLELALKITKYFNVKVESVFEIELEE